MGFGIDIGGALKSAVKSAGDFVSGAAKTVENTAQTVEQKVSDAAKSAWDKISDGFDPPAGQPIADSKPKGGSGSTYA
jgi:hypothetical protein